MWRDVEEVNVGDVVRGVFEWAFVWGEFDPHGGGLGAGEPDDSVGLDLYSLLSLAFKIWPSAVLRIRSIYHQTSVLTQ